MQLFQHPIVIIDTETTGVYNHSEIIEIGAICLDEWGQERSYFTAFIKPKERNLQKILPALLINHITPQDLEHAADMESVRIKFREWFSLLEHIAPNIQCVAYNAPFDKRFLDKAEIYLPWGKCLLQQTNAVMKKHNYELRTDTGRKKSPSLQDACAFLHLPYPENAHRALIDARVAGQVLCKIMAYN